jgi:hypothetical protein
LGPLFVAASTARSKRDHASGRTSSPLSGLFMKPPRRRKLPEDELRKLTEDFSLRSAYLVQMWANCESWFPHILAVLLKTDVQRANLVFFSFTSTRARVDLVKRAAIMCLPKPRSIRHYLGYAMNSTRSPRLATRFATPNTPLVHTDDQSPGWSQPTTSARTLTVQITMNTAALIRASSTRYVNLA